MVFLLLRHLTEQQTEVAVVVDVLMSQQDEAPAAPASSSSS
jgi:hypothetical protein